MYKLKNTNRIHKYDTQKHEMGIKGGKNVDINSLQNKLSNQKEVGQRYSDVNYLSIAY
jgi:hypothetical protein